MYHHLNNSYVASFSLETAQLELNESIQQPLAEALACLTTLGNMNNSDDVNNYIYQELEVLARKFLTKV